ncbi:hypothetical protein [Halosegnis sp.]|uniref:hypothetical protein n=1 Tax=Halosegnis sp. TaxID=2864959 RepID=UPI0035D51C0D
MTDSFIDPDDPSDEWIDVRMTDPEAGEWEVDAVVLDGRVEYVDLRVQPNLLSGFLTCLLEDLDDERAASALAAAAERRGVEADASG